MSPLVRPELFWSTAQVEAALGRPDVRVVDCRYHGGRDLRGEYLAGHLPGAVYCDWSKDLVAPPPSSGHPASLLPSAEAFARLASRLGISNDTMVIAYDLEGGHQAARLWLALRRYGHDRFAVMEGCLAKWVADGRPLERGEVAVPPGRFEPRPVARVVATKAEVLDAVRVGHPWLLDVRRSSEYTGEEVRAARGGHIPGAVHFFWRDALKDDWTLRDPDELESTYQDAGFGPDTSTITYCQAGVRAAFTHLVLTALGHDDVRTYDGSWDEWGNDPTMPVVTGRQ